MKRNHLIGAIAMAAALTGGGAAGAILGTPSLSNALTAAEAPADSTSTDVAPAGEPALGGREFGPRMEGLEAAAETLDLTVEELHDQLRDGKTIAQIAEAKNVDVNTVIDAMVAAAKERLAEIEAELPDRITDFVNNGGPIGPGPGGFGHHGERFEVALATAAEAIGISEDDLRAALDDGKTIAEVAKAHDVEPQAVIDALVKAASARIDARVADGDLTEDEAADMKDHLTEHITHLVNEGPHFRR